MSTALRTPPRLTPQPRGFTLVEILVVVVVLGILAAIAIPQFSSASETARANSTLSMLKTLRAQLELYKVHHNEEYPPLDGMWENLMETTDEQGNLAADGPLGPYLQKPPLNPYTGSTTIVGFDQGGAGDGWEYNPDTGDIRAVGFDEDTRTFTRPGETASGDGT